MTDAKTRLAILERVKWTPARGIRPRKVQAVDLVSPGAVGNVETTFATGEFQYSGELLAVLIDQSHDKQSIETIAVRIQIAGKTIFDDGVGCIIPARSLHAGDAISMLVTPSSSLCFVEVFLLGWEHPMSEDS